MVVRFEADSIRVDADFTILGADVVLAMSAQHLRHTSSSRFGNKGLLSALDAHTVHACSLFAIDDEVWFA